MTYGGNGLPPYAREPAQTVAAYATRYGILRLLSRYYHWPAKGA
jgi:hypothetical protein